MNLINIIFSSVILIIIGISIYVFKTLRYKIMQLQLLVSAKNKEVKEIQHDLNHVKGLLKAANGNLEKEAIHHYEKMASQNNKFIRHCYTQAYCIKTILEAIRVLMFAAEPGTLLKDRLSSLHFLLFDLDKKVQELTENSDMEF